MALILLILHRIQNTRGYMRVSLIRKLWKQKVEIPVLQKKVDKTLKEINVKLKRSKHNVR